TIAFTDVDITDKYAAYLDLSSESITVLGQTMPILIIRNWEVSIRPCELENFARIFGPAPRIQSSHTENRNLMQYLTKTHSSLLDLVDMTDSSYYQIRTWALGDSRRSAAFFPALDQAREISRANRPGSRVFRYLLLQMRNQVIKAQFDPEPCSGLSNLRLSWS